MAERGLGVGILAGIGELPPTEWVSAGSLWTSVVAQWH